MNLLSNFVFIAIIALTGCATQNVTSSYSLDASNKNGIAIASITYQGLDSGYGVLYRELSGKTSGLFEAGHGVKLIPLPNKSDFGTIAKGKLVVAELSPGEYEIFNWRISSGYASVSPKNKFSIHFTIEPGKAVYIGNFNFIQTRSMGLTVTGGELTFKGEQDRDLTTLKSMYPNFANTPISYATPADVSISKLGGTDNVRFDIPMVIGK